jgi:hypothetical protein
MVLSREVTPNELLDDPTLLLHEKNYNMDQHVSLKVFWRTNLTDTSNRQACYLWPRFIMVSLFSFGLTLLPPKDALWILVAMKITTDTDDFICRACCS